VQHELSTDDLTFICSGAFEGLEDIIAKRTRTSAKKATLRSLYDKLVASDLIEYGINPQLLGRFDHILTFDELKVQDLIDALIKPKDSPLNVQRQMLEEFYGTSLLVDHDVYEHIASIALHNKALGARALRQMSKELLAPYVSHLEHYARKGTLRITLPMAREMLARYENLGEKEAKEIGFE
jgi:ATP-dependent Clp protease ATP-binding subunit ClpX